MSLKFILSQLNNKNKIIITDKDGGPKAVVLSYLEYKNLLKGAKSGDTKTTKNHSTQYATKNSLTSNEVLDKINRKIAQWKEMQNPRELEKGYFIERDIEEIGDINRNSAEDVFYLEEEE